MKKIKKVASILLAVVMVMAMTVSAFGAEAAATGSITIKSAENVSVAGKTFNAYKILDLEMVGTDGYVYTVPEEMKNFYATKFNLNVNSGSFDYEVAQKIAEMSDDSAALFGFAADALAAAKEAGVENVTETGSEDGTEVKFENLPLGYYVIEDAGSSDSEDTDTAISALMLDSTDPDVTITLKADQPPIEKKIDGDKDSNGTEDGLVDYNEAAIGDKVPYVLTSKVPDMTGYTSYYYAVTDTFSKGLTYNEDVEITVGDVKLTPAESGDYTYTVKVVKHEEGATTVEIIFNNFIKYTEGAEIKITYSATVNEEAVIGTAGNPNTVTLEYSNDPNSDRAGLPDGPTGITPPDKVYTYVTDLEIIKVDSKGNRLTGAEFELKGTRLNTVLVEREVFIVAETDGTHWKLKDGTYTAAAPTDATKDSYADTTTKYKLETEKKTIMKEEDVIYQATVGEDGVLTFAGLAAGQYTITEIKAPDGYNLLKNPINVTIGWTAPEGSSTECEWTYTWTNENSEVTNEGPNSVTVTNNAGTELPSTGGMGTTIFYIAGGALVLVAVVLLVTKRRMRAE